MLDVIERFVADKKVAIAGASPDSKKWGSMLMKDLQGRGYEVTPVHPSAEEIAGVRCVASPVQLPEDMAGLIIALAPSRCAEVARACIGSPVKRVWMQRGVGRGSWSEEGETVLREHGIAVVHGVCPMMFYGGGRHRVHLWFRRILGGLPADFDRRALPPARDGGGGFP